MGSPVGHKSAGNAPSERRPEFAIPCVCDSMAEVPYVYSHDDLCRLLQTLDSSQCGQIRLEPITTRTIILLLYGTGLHVGEATRLNRVDVDLEHSLLTIRHTKFHKSRLAPFGPKLGQVLTRYAARAPLSAAEAPFFTMRTGTRVIPDTLEGHFRSLCMRAGVQRKDESRFQPRLHDLRHNADCRIMPTQLRSLAGELVNPSPCCMHDAA